MIELLVELLGIRLLKHHCTPRTVTGWYPDGQPSPAIPDPPGEYIGLPLVPAPVVELGLLKKNGNTFDCVLRSATTIKNSPAPITIKPAMFINNPSVRDATLSSQ